MQVGISLGMGFPEPLEVQAVTAAEAGYAACFTDWVPGRTAALASAIRRAGLLYQSVHAPFGKMASVWEDGAAGDAALSELCDCVRDCSDAGIRMVVVHAIIGFDRHTPTSCGLRRFERLIRTAEDCGTVLAFENTEGEAYLEAVLSAFSGSPACGFCWDSGHEMCYNGGRDLLALYGTRLAGTHLNDNLGQTDASCVTWLDDAHLMPGDGCLDVRSLPARLEAAGYDGILTMELTRVSKPGRSTHAAYASLSLSEFMSLALTKVRRIFEKS